MERQIALQELAIVLDLPVAAIDKAKSFIGSGGHSITALQFAARCRERQVSLALDDILRSETIEEVLDSCQCLAPQPSQGSESTQPSSSKTLSALQLDSNHQDGLVDSVLDLSDNETSNLTVSSDVSDKFHMVATTAEFDSTPSGSLATAGDNLRLVYEDSEELCDAQHVPDGLGKLTEIQLSLIHGSFQKRGTNIIHYYETYRASQISRMKSAWKQVVQGEQIFRTPYRNPADGCYMIPKFHWRELETNRRSIYEEALRGDNPLAVWQDMSDGAIDLSNRFTVISLCDQARQHHTSTIIWSIHHALIDGWSATKVLNKVHQAASGFPICPGTSFLDLAASLEQLQKNQKAEGDAFWQRQQERVAEARDKFLLPPPSQQSSPYGGKKVAEFVLSLRQHWEVIGQAARSCEVTIAAVLHAAWAITLATYTDSDNVVFGTVVSGRSLPLPGVFDAIGPLLNTLPFQVTLSRKLSARQLLANVFNSLQDLSQFAWTTPDNGFSRSFESIFAMQLEPEDDGFGPVAAKPLRPTFSIQTTNIPLSIVVNARGKVKLQFSPTQFHESHMRGVAKCFRDAIVSLTHIDMCLDTCMSGVTTTETLSILRHFGNCESSWTTRSHSSDDLVTLFEAAASNYPDSTALEAPNCNITYSELNRLSGLLASELADLLAPEEVVSVHTDGSVNWIIAIWAVLRAGGTYCPIDKHHPQVVRDSIFASCKAKYFLATSKEALRTRFPVGLTVIDVAAVLEAKHQASHTEKGSFPHRTNPRPWENAYVCFTSGSTGKPKGVVCTHEGLVAFQRDLKVRLFAQPGQRVAQVMSAAFDGSIHEIFSSLCYGATLILRDDRDPLGHLQQANSAILTPSIAMHLKPADYPLLNTVYLVGEAVPQRVCDTWASSKTVYNMYGPTEATCGATIARLLPGHSVTIGKPNPSTRVYILNHHRQLAPVGRIGEIWLAGVQVARGYIGQPELTRKCFFPDTICKGLGEYMYRTGDHGYWNQDGEIVFLGRADRLVKLRGFRLDLDDLETRILQCCSDVQAVAVACKDKTDLVCMMQTSERDVARLRPRIVAALPVYAVPRYIVPVDKLPMTGIGKIDYKAVIEATVRDTSLETEDKLQTATEKRLAVIWASILGLTTSTDVIKPSSTFTDLGGHSLRQLHLVAILKNEFDIPINLRIVMEFETLRDLAQEIDSLRLQQSDSIRLKTYDKVQVYSLSPVEQHWWQRYTWGHGLASFNVSFVCKYDSRLVDRQKLVAAWNTVLFRHKIFRSRYIHHRKRGLERTLTLQPPRVQNLERIDIWTELNTPFAPDSSPPVRVLICRDTIVAVLSHIVCDYTTLSLLLEEVSTVYCSGVLPPIVQKYHETMVWNNITPSCSMAFWEKYLKGVAHTQPAYLGNKSARSSYRGKSFTTRIMSSLWHRIAVYMKDHHITGQQLALAATALALSSRNKSLDVVLGVPFLNRQTEADMRTVGLFLEPLPVRIAFQQHAHTGDRNTDGIFPRAPLTRSEYVAAVQSLSQRALANAMSWGKLLEHLGISGTDVLPDHPLFDCVVSYHDMRPTAGGAWRQLDLMDGGTVEPQLVWSEGAKFKLMIEFMALSDDALVMRLEYDDTCYEGVDHVAAVGRLILRAFDAVISPVDSGSHDSNHVRSEQSFAEAREEMMKIWRKEESAAFVPGQCDYQLVDDVGDLFQRPLGSIDCA